MNRQDYRKAFDAISFSEDFAPRTQALLLKAKQQAAEKERQGMKWKTVIRSAGLAAVAVVEMFLFYGFFFGWRRIVVKSVTCEDAAVPQAFDGYKVLQLSDIHIGTFLQTPAFIEKLVRVVNAQEADIVVFTGDLVNVSATELLHDRARQDSYP